MKLSISKSSGWDMSRKRWQVKDRDLRSAVREERHAMRQSSIGSEKDIVEDLERRIRKSSLKSGSRFGTKRMPKMEGNKQPRPKQY
jgi:hypothetical protein